jgi:hypothetical protein
MRWHEAAPMPIHHETLPGRLLEDALAATLWFAPSHSELEALKSLLGSRAAAHVAGSASEPDLLPADDAGSRVRPGATATLLRHAVSVPPSHLRPYFAVCALEAWRRVPVRQLAGWSGIPWSELKRRMATARLTPAGIATWNLALHATWLLDVAELPASTVVRCMRLGRPAALSAVLGARAVRFSGGKVDSGAFAAALDGYISVLRAAFRV